MLEIGTALSFMPRLGLTQKPVPGPSIDPVDPVDPVAPVTLARAGALSFPQDNNVSAGAHDLALRQDASAGWFTMWNTEAALFVIARRSLASSYNNETHKLVDGITNGSRQSFLQMRGGAYGVPTERNVLNGRISTAGVVVDSQPVTEDAFLGVLRRDVDRKGVLDWYSLATGTKYAGSLGGTIFQSQTVPSDPAGYSFRIGGDASGDDARGTEWPGDIAAIGYVEGDVPDSVWQSIALGASLETALAGYTVPWVREFDGSPDSLSKPAWATDDATLPTAIATGNAAFGSTLRRAAAASYLTVNEAEDGYVYGLLPDEASRNVTFSGTSAGRTGNVEARVFYRDTGELLVDWTSVGAVSANWSGSLTVPRCAQGWVVAQFRTTDAPDEVTHAMRRFAVGYKFLQLGQSQTTIYMGSAVRGDLPAAYDTMSLANDGVDTGQPIVQQMTFIGARTSDGLSAFADQFRAYADKTPVMVIGAAKVGTGPDQLMDDAETNRDWSKLQAKLDHWGNDVTAVLMNWATQGWATNGTVAETMEALIYGTGDYGGTVDHSLTAALRAGFAFGLSPATRHSNGVHNSIIGPQVAFANARGLTVGLPVSDYAIEDEGGPHPDNNALGNRVLGVRMAHLAARITGFDVPARPYFSTATRLGNAITIQTVRPNGGALSSPAPNALRNFEVDEGAGFTNAGFTAAIGGNAVVLTKSSGVWASGTVVRYLENGETRTDNDAAAEAAIVAGMLYEARADDVLGLGLPVVGTLVDGRWVPDWQVST